MLPEFHYNNNVFTFILAGQVDAVPVRCTKTSESNANCNSLSKDGEYELVRGASEKIELAFSNPLYAEPEREVTCEIYESVSSSFLTHVLTFFSILQFVCHDYMLDELQSLYLTCTCW